MNTRVLVVLCLAPVLLWSLQYGRQIWLDGKAATIRLGASARSVVEVLGEPTEVDQTEGTAIYCYYVGYPFSLIHPEEWQFEFDMGGLIRKESTIIRPPW